MSNTEKVLMLAENVIAQLDEVQSIPVPETRATETVKVNGKKRVIRKAVRGQRTVKSEPSNSTETSAIEYADDIFQSANFRDLEHFEAVLNDYQLATNTKYKVDSSKCLPAGTDPDTKAKFRYEHVVYKCIHFGQPRKRSTGVRQCKQYLALGCKSRLRLYFRPQTTDMCVTLFEGSHNHKLELLKTVNGCKVLPELLANSNDETVECVPKKRQKLSDSSTPNTPALPIPPNTPIRTPLAPLSTSKPSAPSNMAQLLPSFGTSVPSTSSNTSSTLTRTPLAPSNTILPVNDPFILELLMRYILMLPRSGSISLPIRPNPPSRTEADENEQ